MSVPQRLIDRDTRRQLAEQVAIIERNLGSICEIGKALATIREEKLYRLDYKTFDEFCKDKFGFGRTKANGLIADHSLPQLTTSQVAVRPQNGHTETSEVANSIPQQDSGQRETTTDPELDTCPEELKDLGDHEESNPGLDAWGIPIQPHAAQAFESCAQFDELIDLLKRADKLYSQLAEQPGGMYLRRPGISINSRDRWRSQHIGTALLNAKDCKPTYTVCPRAYHAAAFPESNHKHDDSCTLCRGLNWSRPLGKNEVQPEAIAAAKQAFVENRYEDVSA